MVKKIKADVNPPATVTVIGLGDELKTHFPAFSLKMTTATMPRESETHVNKGD